MSIEVRFRRLPMLGATLALASVLSGCGTFVDAQVTSFHQLADPWQGRRIVVEPRDGQRDSLEWKAYADQVRQALIGKGFVDAGSAAPDLRVRLDYRIEGRAQSYSHPVYGYGAFGPVWGWDPYYYGRAGFGWRAYYPMTYGVVGSGVSQYRVWTRELKVEMTKGGDGTKVFEGTAVSDGEINALPTIMPLLVRALFDDFPGVNGQTRRLRVELRPDQSARSQ